MAAVRRNGCILEVYRPVLEDPSGSRPCFLDESAWTLESPSLETLKALSRDIFRAREESDIEICPRR